ncbi:hypothetical protein ABG067_009561, partial [Albugo candida]
MHNEHAMYDFSNVNTLGVVGSQLPVWLLVFLSGLILYTFLRNQEQQPSENPNVPRTNGT